MAGKQYGLIFPGQQKKQLVQRKTIFDEENELEDDVEEDFTAPAPRGPSSIPSKVKRETKMVINKALEEDPTVFDYDGVYDEMKAPEKKKDTAPRYMNNLLKCAEIRKRDQERREEKKIQKEREAEGNEFEEKEAFVTSAYKEKLKELRETEEREKREEKLENMFDVKKQKDLSGFHRHLLNQQIGEEAVPEVGYSSHIVQLPETSFKSRKVKNQVLRSRRDEQSDGDEDDENEGKVNGESVALEEEQKEEEKTESVTEQATESETQIELCKDVEEDEKPKYIPPEPIDRTKVIQEIFTKRTVGEKFEEAVKRYQERKGLLATT